MIKFNGINNEVYYIAKWAIQAIWSHDSKTIIEVDNNTFKVVETVDEALKLWGSTE